MKQIQIPVYETGDIVKTTKTHHDHKAGEYALVVKDQDGHDGNIITHMAPNRKNGARTNWHINANCVAPVTDPKELAAAKASMPVMLSIESLEDPLTINPAKGVVNVGCQNITFADALKIVAFLSENVKIEKAVKRARKKARVRK